MQAKCFYCNRPSIVYLRYANLRLCEKHFVKFVEDRVRKTIERYKMIKENDKVLVAVSGGKDSIVLLNILKGISNEYSFSVYGFTIDLGIKRYSKYVEIAEKSFRDTGIEYKIYSLEKEHGFTLDDVVGKMKTRKPCSVCGMIKRYILNKYAYEHRFNKIATGHNLDDITALQLLHLLRGNLEGLKKLVPVLEGRGKLVTRIRPLTEVYEKDIELYSKIKGFEVVEEKCPYYIGAKTLFYKDILENIERESPSSKIVFFRMVISKIIPMITTGNEEAGSLKTCRICGMPSSRDVCSFCRLEIKMEG